MSRKFTAFIFLFVLSFALTACSLQEVPVIGEPLSNLFSKASEPVTLEMWGLWESEDVMNTLIDQYQELNPHVTINYIDKSVKEPRENLIGYKEDVYTRLTDAGTSPDIVRVHNSWVPGMVSKGILSPATSKVMSVDEYKQVFYPVAAKSAVFGNDIYAIPLYYDGLALFYNKDHFAAAGQTQPPTDWEELRILAFSELTLWGDGNQLLRSGLAMGGAEKIDHFSDILGLMLAQASINVTNKDHFLGEASIETFDYYTGLLKSDNIWSPKFPESVAAFANEQVSMIFAPGYRVFEILSTAPSLNFGVAPVPQASANNNVAWGTFWMEAVSVNSKNPEEAWKFLKFLSEEEQQEALAASIVNDPDQGRPFGLIPSRVSMADTVANNEYLYPIVRTAPYATTSVLAGRAGNRKQYEAVRQAVNDILSGTPVETALENAQPNITP